MSVPSSSMSSLAVLVVLVGVCSGCGAPARPLMPTPTLYTGVDADGIERVGYATSANGTAWTKQGLVLAPSLQAYAADENGISQSGASQMVHHLEERLGVKLIDVGFRVQIGLATHSLNGRQ